MIRTSTYKRLKPIIDSINLNLTISSVTTQPGGLYTLFTCNTLWASIGFTLTIGGNAYKITAVNPNVSITVKGTVLPSAGIIQIYPPKFYHGKIKATNEELQKKTLSTDKLPFIWNHEPTRERFSNDATTQVEVESDCDLYFMLDADFKGNNDHHYEIVIQATRNLVEAFINAVNRHPSVSHEEVKEFHIDDHAKWGELESGNKVFADNLSGTRVKVTIPFLREEECGCQQAPIVRCYDVQIRNENGDLLAEVPSGGTYIITTIPSIITNSNGTYNATVAGGGVHTLPNVTHKDSNNQDVILPGMTPFIATQCKALTSYTCLELDGLTQPQKDCVFNNYQRSYVWHEPSGSTTIHETGDDAWIWTNYFNNLSQGKKPQLVDFFTLQEDNVFGNRARFTNLTGMYYTNPNPTTYTNGQLKNANGTSVNAASIDAATAAFGQYIIDHYRGEGILRSVKGSGQTWTQKCTGALALTDFGFSGWFMGTRKRMEDLANYGQYTGFGYVFDYCPLLLSNSYVGNTSYFTSTAPTWDSTFAYNYHPQGSINASIKASTALVYLAFRKHF